MIRITSGKYRNRLLFTDLPKGVTQSFRPTQAKTRDAVLNKLNFSKLALEGGVLGKRVLDVFCGTGAFGFEALSRGASFVCFVDNVKENIDLVRRTASDFSASEQCLLLCNDASMLPLNKGESYDIIYLDPPYYSNNLIVSSVSSLINGGWVRAESIIVVEIGQKQELPSIAGVCVLDEASYGASRIIYLSILM